MEAAPISHNFMAGGIPYRPRNRQTVIDCKLKKTPNGKIEDNDYRLQQIYYEKEKQINAGI